MKQEFKAIKDYGIIGNLETCALVGKDASLDWLCLPSLDSASVFAAILDPEKGGHFQIKPIDKFKSSQTYSGKTNVLKTYFDISRAKVVITDFMPIISPKNVKYGRAILRKVECLKGKCSLAVSFKPRFNYGRCAPKFQKKKKTIIATSKNERLFLQSPVPLAISNKQASGVVDLKRKDRLWFVLRYGKNSFIRKKDCENILVETKEYWGGWESKHPENKNIFKGPWYEEVVRSGLVLKLLTNSSTGAIAAAATTSLPERVGGVRNWDYRFAWIRDASFTSQALFHLGHLEEAKGFIRWIENITSQDKDPSRIQIMYGLHGESKLREKKLKYLCGYENSYPVRIGNSAAKQKQLDIYGELINAIYETCRYGRKVTVETQNYIKNIVDYVCKVWMNKDSGIWEVRGGKRHFLYSKLMCWVAVDRGIKIAQQQGFNGSLEEWRKTREKIKEAIISKGFNKQLNSFVQAFGSKTLDASSLLIPLMGFLAIDDPRVQGTINAVLKRLTTKKGFVRRYDAADGLPGSEGAFLLCSFWLVKVLALSGRLRKSESIFKSILREISPLGLFSEEIDTKTNRQLGNFPQAFSHIGLINSALYIGIARGKKHKWPKPMGF